jgi:hypothetical protein
MENTLSEAHEADSLHSDQKPSFQTIEAVLIENVGACSLAENEGYLPSEGRYSDWRDSHRK